jgi:hypothetical protein
LKEVPNWSNAMSKRHSDNITGRCSWFSDLLAAVFVACTKILSAVRLKADNKKIALKLPTEEVFIQTCYNNAARDIYKDPYIFHEEQSEYARDDILTARFSTCIENTVKELIPVQLILQTYMSQETRDISLDGEVQDGADPDVLDEGEFPEEEPEQVPDEIPEEPQSMMEPQPTGLENEFKTVPGVQATPVYEPEPEPELEPRSEEYQEPVPLEEDEGVLFRDAPERRIKNPRYN